MYTDGLTNYEDRQTFFWKVDASFAPFGDSLQKKPESNIVILLTTEKIHNASDTMDSVHET